MRVLLVDHDSEALETISRAIRGVLELDCVTSKGDALLLLRQNAYDVLIACERCVDGSGLDLLARTARTAVPLKRIFASAQERLQLLGPRLAPFKVQRTINYPIDLEELWLAIAQVTSDPDEETDGTIERVVLDERGIPASGSVPRAPITTTSPPRPPAPLAAMPSPAPAIASAGRAATARLTQPVPEPPLRPPPPPRQPPQVARPPAAPRTTSDTGRMRALAPPIPPSPPMTSAGPEDFPAWATEAPSQEDFAEVAAQARIGVQQKAVDEVSRRKRMRVMAAGGIAIAVAGVTFLLVRQFYDPEARAREKAIAEQIKVMNEQQQVKDNLALIEIDIESAIMSNDFEAARRKLAQLGEKAPDHPRLAFLEASIDRAEALAKLSPESVKKEQPGSQTTAPSPGERSAARPRTERTAERAPAKSTTRPSERSVTSRPQRDTPPPQRVYGAPIGDSPQQSIPLDAPINSAPVTSVRRGENSFSGRTVEASDSAVGRTPAPAATLPVVTTAITQPASNSAGSAVPPAPVSASAAAPVDVVPARIVKRVTPVAPGDIPPKTSGYVIVRFSIGVNGRVTDLAVVESQPQGVFDQAAQDAVRKWVYEPRKENGVAVESSAKARLVFDAAN